MLRVLDTFAGAGGFSLGFTMAGCTLAGGIEADSWASETFAFNHPHATVITADITRVSDEQLRHAFPPPGPDIVLGGPPCQGFSVCVKNAGDPSDPRNTLFLELLRITRLFRPMLVVMENVPKLEEALTNSKARVIDIIRAELESLEYNVYHTVLQATDFGIPQIRRRLFVVGSRCPLAAPFPDPTHAVERVLFDLKQCPTLWEAISDLPPISAGEGAEESSYDKPSQTEYQRAMRRGCRTLYNHVAMRHSRRMIERFAAMSWGDRVGDVPYHLRPQKRNGGGTIAETVYDQNNRRMYPDRPCHTIPASFYANFVHPYIDRNFTPREGARLQSFPDWYVFKGKPTVVSHKLLEREGRSGEKHLCQYNQIGNAVPPLLAKSLAEHLLRQLGINRP
jgi:DNA (cytosine-5)-methyltransferase 1